MKSLILILVVLFVSVYSKPVGDPHETCVSPYENIHGSNPQLSTTNLYDVTASGDEYNPGTKLTVTIEGKDGEAFKGYYFVAFDVDTNNIIGEWEATTESMVLDKCHSITQKDTQTVKNKIVVTWNAPDNGSGKVKFVGILVKDRFSYWNGIVAKN